MKVAVSSTGKDLNSRIDPRFGRCACFVIVETDDMSFEAFENENIGLSGGVGVQSASFVSSKGAAAVLTGNCGPKATRAFLAGGIDLFTGQTGTVGDAVERYKKGGLQPAEEASVHEKSGLDGAAAMDAGSPFGAGGRGVNRGGGRCMGGPGRGMGLGRRGGGGCGRGRSAAGIGRNAERR